MGMLYRVVFAISATVLPMLVSYWLKKQHKKKLQEVSPQLSDPNSYLYHCIFWNMDNLKCRQHVFNNTNCGNTCSITYLNTILKFLSSAKESIDLCMYHLTLKQVVEQLILAQKRGVNVRIITDYVASKMQHSRMTSLKENYGFDVRAPPYSESYMHHKYCVIDAKNSTLRKMFMGSLNLTLQGLVANFEFVVITNNPNIILSYSDEFDILWTSLED